MRRLLLLLVIWAGNTVILAGATAVAMGTALFIDPRSPVRVVDGLDAWVSRQGCRSVNELIGMAGA